MENLPDLIADLNYQLPIALLFNFLPIQCI